MDTTPAARSLIVLTGAVVFLYLLVTIAWQLAAVAVVAGFVVRAWWRAAAAAAASVVEEPAAAVVEPTITRIPQPAV